MIGFVYSNASIDRLTIKLCIYKFSLPYRNEMSRMFLFGSIR